MPEPRRSPSMLVLAAVLLASPLTGCIGTSAPSASPDDVSRAGTPSVPETNATPRPAGSLAYDTEPARTVLWANGSFPAQGTARGQAGIDDANQHAIDLTEHVPVSIPTHIHAAVTWDEGPGPTDTARTDLDVDVEGNLTVYAFEAEDTGGREHETIDAARFADEPVEVVVTSEAGTGGNTVDYTLRIEIVQAPQRVPADAPTLVPVGPETAAIEAQPVRANTSASLMAWNASDGYLGHHEAEAGEGIRVPVDEAGAHVVAANASMRLRLVDDGDEPVAGAQPLGALPYEIKRASPHPLPVQGPETASFDVERTPLAVAVGLQGSRDRGQTIDRFAFHVESPSGTVMDVDFPCSTACQAFGAAVGLEGMAIGPLVDEDAAAGPHEVTADYNRSTNLELVPGWVTYRR